MALKDIFTMVKADRYTADGREVLNKAREADVEDRRYNIGEISEKTGLQKTANGWKPPKETKFGKVKQNKEGQWGVQTKQGKGSDFLKHKSEKEASRALANYTAGYNTTERSKQDPHSDWARQQKQWNKETDRMRKASNAERRAEHASHFAKAESKPAEGKQKTAETPKAPKPSVQEYMKAKQDIKQFEDTYKKQNEQYEARQRMGEGAAALSPLWGLKPNDYKNDPQYKKAAELVKAFEAEDSAPRVLTGDTRIRVRK